MATHIPPKKNTEYIFYMGLPDQADTKLFKSSATIAAGDFKVSIDGGALANPATLPAVTPAASKMVKVTLSASEMNGDNITLIASDAAGAEWCDVIINIPTSARQIDDLAFPTVSGRSLDVTATGAAGIDWGNVENPTTAVDLSGTDIQLADTTTTVTNSVTADMTKINGVAASAANLEQGAFALQRGAAIAGTLSATQMSTDLAETTANHFNGRIITWTSGALNKQSTDITAYSATGVLTYTTTTEAPSIGDTFVIS